MNCNVFVDHFLDAFRDGRELVLIMGGGAKIVINPFRGMKITLPENSGIVNPFEPEGYDVSFVTRSEAYSDRDLIGLKGRFTVYSAGCPAQTMDDTWLNIDPTQISAIYAGDKVPQNVPV